MALLEFTHRGIYCPQADCYIDPWVPVRKALITHAHADHATSGHTQYMAVKDSIPLLKHRLGSFIKALGVGYGEIIHINGVKISFHPAGHIIGSAQIRFEYLGEIWVVSGDYKTENDGICTPFEPVRCHTFITESTFGIPLFSWQKQEEIFEQINTWWRQNQKLGVVSIISAYALGKAQRIIQNLDSSIGNIYTHSSIENTHQVLRKQGILLAKGQKVENHYKYKHFEGSMILATPLVMGTAWTRRFGIYDEAFVSGWMNTQSIHHHMIGRKGFTLSDHADWEGLKKAVRATGAENIFVTHGYSELFAKWLRENGYNANPVRTPTSSND